MFVRATGLGFALEMTGQEEKLGTERPRWRHRVKSFYKFNRGERGRESRTLLVRKVQSPIYQSSRANRCLFGTLPCPCLVGLCDIYFLDIPD